jgi:hypothetical protein
MSLQENKLFNDSDDCYDRCRIGWVGLGVYGAGCIAFNFACMLSLCFGIIWIWFFAMFRVTEVGAVVSVGLSTVIGKQCFITVLHIMYLL